MYRLLLSLGLVEFFVFMAVVSNRIVTGIGMVAWIIFLYAFSRWNSENLLPLSVLTVARSFSAD